MAEDTVPQAIRDVLTELAGHGWWFADETPLLAAVAIIRKMHDKAAFAGALVATDFAPGTFPPLPECCTTGPNCGALECEARQALEPDAPLNLAPGQREIRCGETMQDHLYDIEPSDYEFPRLPEPIVAECWDETAMLAYRQAVRTDAFQQRHVTHVAIQYSGKTYALPRPNRHHHIIRMIGGIKSSDRQGFLDNYGYFLNRRDALAIALLAGQVKNVNDIRAHQLFSEDLW